MFLRGAAAYEFRGGRRLSLSGEHLLIVPPGVKHCPVRDVRSPTVHSSITVDLSARGRGRGPFTRAEMGWLQFGTAKTGPIPSIQ